MSSLPVGDYINQLLPTIFAQADSQGEYQAIHRLFKPQTQPKNQSEMVKRIIRIDHPSFCSSPINELNKGGCIAKSFPVHLVVYHTS